MLKDLQVDVPSDVIFDIIPVGPLSCNCCIIADSKTKHAIVVDPGGDAEVILDNINRRQLVVKQILVTHGHFDHFLAADDLRKATEAPVCLHEADVDLWRMLPMQLMLFGMQRYAKQAAIRDPDRLLKDGEKLAILSGQVMHVPGHSPGSAAFYFPNHNLLMSGDTLFRQSVGRTDLVGGNSDTLISSIQQKLYKLPDSVGVIPGHGPATTIGFEKKNNMVVRENSTSSPDGDS